MKGFIWANSARSTYIPVKEIDLYVLPRIWFRLLVLVFICKATVRDAMIDSSGSGLPDPVSPPQMRLFTNTKIYKYKNKITNRNDVYFY